MSGPIGLEKLPRRLRGWMPLIAFGAIYTAAMMIVAAWRADPDPQIGTSDFRDYWLTARYFGETGRITEELGVHNYLPFFTIFMLPWSVLPLKFAAGLFTLVSLGAFALTVLMVEMLLNKRIGPRPRPALLVALVLVAPYVHSCAVLGQVSLLLLFLVIATWFLVEHGREWEAGLPLGLAILIKLLPAAAVPLLLLKRRWRAVACAAAVMLVLGVGLPLSALGPNAAIEEHREFFQGAVVEHSAYTTITSEKPRKAKYNNQSLPIVLRRLLSPLNGDAGENRPGVFVNIADLPLGGIWIVYVSLMLLILTVSAAATMMGRWVWPPETPGEVAMVRAQFGVWCCVMLLASPLLWTHYLPLAYWPLAVLADRVERTYMDANRWDRVSITPLLIWLAAAILLAWPAARAAGANLWAVGVLWGAMVWAVKRS